VAGIGPRSRLDGLARVGQRLDVLVSPQAPPVSLEEIVVATWPQRPLSGVAPAIENHRTSGLR
jgi:hypothetical protein